MTLPPWTLHPQLADDCTMIGDLPLSRLLLSNDARYPWLLLVPRRAGASEIIDLDLADRHQLMTEIDQVSRTLKTATGCDRLNVAAIGNMVPQLHVHVVARWRGDPAWPKPVWGTVPPRLYENAESERLREAIRSALSAFLASPSPRF